MSRQEGVEKGEGFGVCIVIEKIGIRSIPRKGIVFGGVGVRVEGEGDRNGSEEVVFRDGSGMRVDGLSTDDGSSETSDAWKMVGGKVLDKGVKNG